MGDTVTNTVCTMYVSHSNIRDKDELDSDDVHINGAQGTRQSYPAINHFTCR